MKTIKGTFTSVWDDGGAIIVTSAELNTETGEVTTLQSGEGQNVDILDREYFTDEHENEHEVCTTCHEYIMKAVMVDGVGSTLNEVKICSNPDCESNEK